MVKKINIFKILMIRKLCYLGFFFINNGNDKLAQLVSLGCMLKIGQLL